MTPFANAATNQEYLFNHSFLLTLFYVELLVVEESLVDPSQLTHEVQCALVYATMILHKICVVERENELLNWVSLLGGTDSSGQLLT